MSTSAGVDYAVNVTENMTTPSVNIEWNLDLTAYSSIIYTLNVKETISSGSEDPTFLPTIVIYAIAFFIGVIGNAIVVLVLLIDKKARNVTNSFMVSLAVADLLFLLLIVPYDIVVKLLDYAGGRVFCKMSKFVEMLSVSASIWNLTAVSVERYIVIVHPMKTRTLCTFGTTKKIIVAVWGIAIGLSIPCLYIYDTTLYLFYNENEYGISEYCAVEHYNRGTGELLVFLWYHMTAMIILPTTIMGFCYIMVIRVLWVSTRELAKMTNCNRSSEVTSLARHGNSPRQQSSEMVEARKQVIRMLITVIVIFLICWCPKLIMSILRGYGCTCLHNDLGYNMTVITNALPYIQSALNPIIYCSMSRNFRQSIVHAFHVCFPAAAGRNSDSMGLGSLKHPSSNTNNHHGPQTIDTECD